ncbi:2-hydroxyacid dehydrogenase [Chakrabartyella piscis]|uniref:2-hydroxyacid dehydrogenase n=1 Tax=Chakrabartyella piscis TaxID=2918914 RepID=UPI00295888A9|nr:2-hydroxyacid dehydrogenase [Chakrabartyella piscis]
MIKIGLTGVYFEGAKEALIANVPEGYEIVFVNDKSEYDKLEDVQYVINRLAVDNEIFTAAKNLKFLQKWGAGFDDCDIQFAGEMGISVASCPGVNARPVAELALMHMLSTYRNLVAINRNLVKGIWPKSEFFGRSFMIEHKTVGIIGLGNIGKIVAKLTSALGANVIYYDIERQWAQEESFGYKFVDSMEELLKVADIVTVHCPLNTETRGLIGKKELEWMQPTSILINTARGPIVNEEALVEALENGIILGAGIDNFNVEPAPQDHPLLHLPNVSATAHAAGNTRDNDVNMVRYCYQNIVNFENGLPFNSERDWVNKQYMITSK